MFQITALKLLSAWAVLQNWIYWNYLPNRVAIHFGIDGRANQWMDKNAATMLMMAIQIAFPWILVAIASGIRVIPIGLINIPHREYWLTGERRSESLRYIMGMLASIAVLESLFVSAINHLSFVANRTTQSLDTPMFLTVLAVFFVATMALVIAMLRRFRVASPSAKPAN